jgi:acyl-CoA thioesterase I
MERSEIRDSLAGGLSEPGLRDASSGLRARGNDRRKGRPDRPADIQSRLSVRGIPVIMLANGMLRGLPHQPDGQHLTPEGYHMLAQSLASQLTGAIRR